MKKHIVCFGDSNTHGYCADPRDSQEGGARFNEEERWTCLMQKALGEDYKVIEEGLSGRTTVFEDPLTEGLSGLSMITPILMSHKDVDLLIIMLGTNDCKQRFGNNAYVVAQGLSRLISKAKATDCWHLGFPNILVVAPPAIREEMLKSPAVLDMGKEAVETSKGLARQFAFTCLNQKCTFLDANGSVELNALDGMHLTARGHAQLAEKLTAVVKAMV